MAIYMPNTEELNIYGGTLKGATAVYVKAGTTISGGTLIATADKTDFRHSNGGCYATGEALVVEACDYPGENPTVIITGGEFEVKENGGAKQVGLYEYGGAEITQFESAVKLTKNE